MKSSTSFELTFSPSSESVWTNAVAVASDSSSCAVVACFSRRSRKEGAYRCRSYEFKTLGEGGRDHGSWRRNWKLRIPDATPAVFVQAASLSLPGPWLHQTLAVSPPAAYIRGLEKRAFSLQMCSIMEQMAMDI